MKNEKKAKGFHLRKCYRDRLSEASSRFELLPGISKFDQRMKKETNLNIRNKKKCKLLQCSARMIFFRAKERFSFTFCKKLRQIVRKLTF